MNIVGAALVADAIPLSAMLPIVLELSATLAGYLIAIGFAPEIAVAAAAVLLLTTIYYGASNIGTAAHWLSDLFGQYFFRRDLLVLDLDLGGVSLTALTASNVHFDLDGDGYAERTGWVSSGDGLLALDLNGNGLIDNGGELFGTAQQDGFTVLRAYDSNGDNQISSADTVYANLRVWRDANQDGVSQSSELVSLVAAGVANDNETITVRAAA